MDENTTSLITLIEVLQFSSSITLLLLLSLMFLALFDIHKYRDLKNSNSYTPKFSVIVPAHNESQVIERTIRKFLETNYREKELIIVNDGSSDETKEVAERFASKIINEDETKITQNTLTNIILVNRVEGGEGKCHALNVGKKYATGEILFFIDADVQMSKDVFLIAAKHFANPEVGAVAGFIDISKKKELLNSFVNFEAITAQKIMRRGFNAIGIHYIIPGGCSIIRKSIIDKIGDYHDDTLAEDTDITWRIATETKTKIRYDSDIVVTADEPTSLKNLWNQRVRWARGNIAVTLKYKNRIGRKRFGRAATIGYPFWIASIIVPFTFIFTLIGLFLGMLINVDWAWMANIGKIVTISFFVITVTGIVLNKGRSVIGGVLSPGIPLLFVMITSALFTLNTGIFLFFIILSIPGCLLCVKLSETHPKAASFLQLMIFGYWIFLVTTALDGYFKHLRNKESIWIRTIR